MKKTKIHVLTGIIHYEDTVVLGVFSTQSKAKNFREKYKRRHPNNRGYDDYDINTYVLNEEKM